MIFRITLKRLIIGIFSLVVVTGMLFFAWLYMFTLQVNETESVKFINLNNAPMLQSGQQLKILSWNIQFLAGNQNNHFFFDDGDDDWPSTLTRKNILGQIANVIVDEKPDVVLLQEVDDGAKRTEHEDQLSALMTLLPKEYGNHASTFYWRANFVPHPALMGSVGMKLSTLSKYKITEATRHALVGIQSQSWIMQQMNPKRAVLEIQLPIKNAGSLSVMNTHLSAFAQFSNTMEIQVNQVMDLMDIGETQRSRHIILGGDFNLLPSSIAYSLLDEKGKSYYNPVGTELSPMLQKFDSIPSLESMKSKYYADWFTHSPNHISGALPDRTIDYLFYTENLVAIGQKVRSEDTLLISDHLPVIGVFVIP